MKSDYGLRATGHGKGTRARGMHGPRMGEPGARSLEPEAHAEIRS